MAEARGLDPAEWHPHLLRHTCGTGRMMQTYRAAHSRTRGKNMKCETWIQTVLHIGCAALLVLQGHRILQLQTNWMEDREDLREHGLIALGCAAFCFYVFQHRYYSGDLPYFLQRFGPNNR